MPTNQASDEARTTERLVLEALQESEEKYRLLVESALDPIFTCDATGRYLYVNTAAAAMFGTTPDQIIGKSVEELFPPLVAKGYRAGVMHVIQTGRSLKAEDKSEVDGRTFWFSSLMQPLRDREGRVTAVQGVVRDITTLKQAELALLESEERLRQAVRVSHIGIFDHDHITDTIYQSPEHREIYGLGLDQELAGRDVRSDDGTPPMIPSITHPEDQERVAAAVRSAHDPGGDGVYDVEHRSIRPDGSIRWLTMRAQTFFAGEGPARRPVRTVGAVRDITAAKQAEQERERLQHQLIQAQKMESIGRLAGGVAHDFNNMLSVIGGYAEMAMAQITPAEPLYADLQEIQSAAKRSADLTRQLLAFARRQAVEPKVLRLNDVIAGSLTMLRRLIGENISLVSFPAQDLWLVQIDPTQIDQVLANLSANARDGIAGIGQITIRTANIVLDDDYCAQHVGCVSGNYVRLEVIDDGRGMDEATQLHIFEPFYTTKAEGRGTGLGLATVYGIATQNGGFVNVESEVGVGTTVEIFLPRFAGDPAAAGTGEGFVMPKAGIETILLVEDEAMVLKFGKTLLERLGYSVLPANSPRDAIRLAAEHAGRIQLLITDVVMPEMNGKELADQLMSRDRNLKCLFMSGYFPSETTPLLGEGVRFLQKPFTMNELASKVREAME